MHWAVKRHPLAVGGHCGHHRVAVALVLLGLGLLAGPGWGFVPVSNLSVVVSSLALIGFLAIAIVTLGLEVFRARSVTFATILGACSIYLLIGNLWFGVFVLIETLQPESFVFVETHAADAARDAGALEGERAGEYLAKRKQLFYYTFVTITTLGYGDVRPVSDLARTYAALAAIVGQLYIAILVARLVALHATRPRAP